ncbi:Holliday junction branch migration protein RuvA [Planobacterium oryzisoli]|uniref:Holliday junction branch migration complex subunit RuvA n=1 Tax=Planobacterium oryzisoli TaxID=2771435 RepID=A0A931ECI6_9FLAO|nr:Holliday junction branch migration protein RuvA [Planobacterium oryzisoli]MBF5028104.1 Holliday junction branch migration protein RuvA [Planobacterium oryzisoli]
MIYSLRGTVLEVTPSFCAIEVNGIGYQIGISLQSYQKLQKDAQAFLFISQIIREDANLLFGFISKEERVLFNLLLSVSGVGPSSALIMLSSLSIEEIIEAISSGNSVLLQKVKGIGAKTAQRIVIDLRDKIQILGEVSFKDPLMGSSLESVKQEALKALEVLGISRKITEKATEKILLSTPDIKLEELVKQILRNL